MNQTKQGHPIHLLLLDDQALLRASLAHLLSAEPDLEVVGECGTMDTALDILRTSPVDVMLLDFAHATEGSDRFFSAAASTGFQGRFLIIAGQADIATTTAALKLGSSGVFLKSEAPNRLVQAIRVVATGGVWLDSEAIRLLVSSSMQASLQFGGERFTFPLNDRDRRVMLGILTGLTNKKIGQNLGISEGSVKCSIQQLFHRTGVRTRGQLVRVALESSRGLSVPAEALPGIATVLPAHSGEAAI